MRGLIKFYNKEKGYGFLVGEDNEEYYFSHHAIAYGNLPEAGCHCEFEVLEQKKSGKKAEATSLTLLSPPANAAHRHDDRITCPNCQKKIVPRLVTYRGDAEKSLCPYCGTIIEKFSKETDWVLLLSIAGWLSLWLFLSVVFPMGGPLLAIILFFVWKKFKNKTPPSV